MKHGTPRQAVWLATPFEQAWHGSDAFDRIRELDGEVYRDVPGRRTVRFHAFDRSWFLKYHSGVGWKALFSDWLRGRVPVMGADNEWRALQALRDAGVDTLTPVAFGQRGRNPARRESFLVTADLEDQRGEPMVDLETLCASWVQQPPPPAFKWGLLRRLGAITHRLHDAGIMHRDYYLCHFLLPRSQVPTGSTLSRPLALTPVLIDLHRALLRPRRRQRWIEKDLSGLWFSARHAGLTSRDVWRFLCACHDTQSPRPLQGLHAASWRRIRRRTDAMVRREQRRQQRTRAQFLLPQPDSLPQRWRYSTRDQRDDIRRSLVSALNRCHDAGWLPVDRALRDIREVDGRLVVELTGASALADTLAPRQARLASLAAFLSWFPETADAEGSDMPPKTTLDAARRQRWHRIAPRLYRNTADVRRWSGHGRVAVCKRRLRGPDWDAFLRDPDALMRSGHMLKDGDTTTVVQLRLAGQDCVIKRYNLISAMHALKRAPQPSRAWRHWYHAHRLLTLGAWTPEPLLAMEQRVGPLRRQAWVVTEKITGRDLLQDFDSLQNEETRQSTIRRFRDWFIFMRRHRVNHGDMKISNFINHPAGLLVLDLDGMRWPVTRGGFERGHARDRRRFVRNWQGRPGWREEVEHMLVQVDAMDTGTD